MIKRAACILCVFAMLLSLCGCGPRTAEDYYELGIRYLDEGNYEEAVIAFNSLLEIDPKHVDGLIGRAQALQQLGGEENLEAARADYETALSLDDSREDVRYSLFDLRMEMGDLDGSLELIQDTYQKFGETEELTERVDTLAQAGSEEDSDNGDMLFSLLDLRLDIGDLEGAKDLVWELYQKYGISDELNQRISTLEQAAGENDGILFSIFDLRMELGDLESAKNLILKIYQQFGKTDMLNQRIDVLQKAASDSGNTGILFAVADFRIQSGDLTGAKNIVQGMYRRFGASDELNQRIAALEQAAAENEAILLVMFDLRMELGDLEGARNLFLNMYRKFGKSQDLDSRLSTLKQAGGQDTWLALIDLLIEVGDLEGAKNLVLEMYDKYGESDELNKRIDILEQAGVHVEIQNLFEMLPAYFAGLFNPAPGAFSCFALHDDGSFSGYCYSGDLDLGLENGMPAEGCNFRGKFCNPKKISKYIYSMQLETLSIDGVPGTEYTENGIKHIVDEYVFGFTNAGEFLVYMPGCPVSDMAEGYATSWSFWLFSDLRNPQSLPPGSYGIYNDGLSRIRKFGWTARI